MYETTEQIDGLAERALTAIIEARPELASWCKSQEIELSGLSRLRVLRWICSDLDARNRSIVAKYIGCKVDDLEATARVLQCV